MSFHMYVSLLNKRGPTEVTAAADRCTARSGTEPPTPNGQIWHRIKDQSSTPAPKVLDTLKPHRGWGGRGLFSTWGSMRSSQQSQLSPGSLKKGFYLKCKPDFSLLDGASPKVPTQRSLSTDIPEGNSGQPSSDSHGANWLEGQLLQGRSFACSQELCTAPADTVTGQSLPQHC